MAFGGADPLPTGVQFAIGGAAGMTASALTHPLDTLKVQLQLQGKKAVASSAAATTPSAAAAAAAAGASAAPASSAAPARLGVLGMTRHVVATHGVVGGLYPGLSASLMRQGTYTTARVGIYMEMRKWVEDEDGNVSLPAKVAASMFAGALGAVIGNPADVALVRMQGDLGLPAERRRNYRHVFHAWSRIIKGEGVATLYTGAAPNAQRAALMTVGQLASYDQVKGFLAQHLDDGFQLQFLSATAAGGIAALLTTPVDNVKTRMMNDTTGQYRTALSTFRGILANDGAMAFYRGFIPYFSRLGPQTIVTLLAVEQYTAAYRHFFHNRK